MVPAIKRNAARDQSESPPAIIGMRTTIPDSAIKHVQTALAATRTEENEMETDTIITVWYDDTIT
jgi:hypothetical protein